jgi:hypothetical protein
MAQTSKSGVDLAKLRAMLRKQPRQTIYSMLDEAVGLLPKAKLERLAARFMNVQGLRPDAPSASAPRGLLAEVEAFAEASRRGDYFETFNVNSKNCTEESNGTSAWIAECNRLLDRGVARAKAKGHSAQAEVLASFDILFDLIDRAGSCDLDIVFFADEGGVWSFGIDWSTVLSAWVGCIARQAKDDASYEQRVAEVIDRCERSGTEVSMKLARAVRNRVVSARRSVKGANQGGP